MSTNHKTLYIQKNCIKQNFFFYFHLTVYKLSLVKLIIYKKNIFFTLYFYLAHFVTKVEIQLNLKLMLQIITVWFKKYAY